MLQEHVKEYLDIRGIQRKYPGQLMRQPQKFPSLDPSIPFFHIRKGSWGQGYLISRPGGRHIYYDTVIWLDAEGFFCWGRGGGGGVTPIGVVYMYIAVT